MSVRSRLALTVFLTGLVTALAVIVTVALAFQRFERESTWQRGDAFLARVTMQHDDLLDLHQRRPEELGAFLRNLLLYEPDSQLYLLEADGTVLASTGRSQPRPGFKVSLAPVQQAARAGQAGARSRPGEAAYVMGDDPEHMDAGAVVAARALQRAVIRPGPAEAGAAGYLYLVCRKPGLAAGRLALLGASLASPALVPVVAVILLLSALAAWIIVTVTRPLQVLSDEVATAARAGFTTAATVLAPHDAAAPDEFSRLRGGFHALLATLRLQWDELRRLDGFRREGVSNLSHDLRSPLTATVACLETLQSRWQSDPGRAADEQLLQVALRNTRKAAGMVRSLGDLALLDEPRFQLHLTRLDVGEVLDDIALRFAERAARQGVTLRFTQRGEEPPVAEVDTELFERAVANLVDNALKFTPAGQAIELGAERHPQGVRVTVADQGAGIPEADLPHLFDRLYQGRAGGVSMPREEGHGLGLAIVRRIVELHRGQVSVSSRPGQGTAVTLELPAA